MEEAGVNPLLSKTYKNAWLLNNFQCEQKVDKIKQGSFRSSKEPPRGSQEGPEDNPSEPPGVSKHLPGVAQGTPKVRKTAQELSQYGGNRPKQ